MFMLCYGRVCLLLFYYACILYILRPASNITDPCTTHVANITALADDFTKVKSLLF